MSVTPLEERKTSKQKKSDNTCGCIYSSYTYAQTPNMKQSHFTNHNKKSWSNELNVQFSSDNIGVINIPLSL